MKLSDIARRVIDLSNVVKQEVEARQQDEPLGRRYDPSRERLEQTDAQRALREYLFEQPVAVIVSLKVSVAAEVPERDLTGESLENREFERLTDDVGKLRRRRSLMQRSEFG